MEKYSSHITRSYGSEFLISVKNLHANFHISCSSLCIHHHKESSFPVFTITCSHISDCEKAESQNSLKLYFFDLSKPDSKSVRSFPPFFLTAISASGSCLKPLSWLVTGFVAWKCGMKLALSFPSFFWSEYFFLSKQKKAN